MEKEMDALIKSKIKKEEDVPAYVDAALQNSYKVIKSSGKDLIKRISISAAGIFIVFTVLCNVPTVAKALVDIPGIGELVKVLKLDKGMENAINKNYIQNIYKTVEQDGIKLTITRIIGDSRRFLIGYIIEGTENSYGLNIKSRGEHVPCSIAYGYNIGDSEERFAEISPKYGALPKEISITLEDYNHKIQGVAIAVAIDDKIFKVQPQIIKMDKTVSLRGIDIKIKSLEIFPTSIVLKYSASSDEYNVQSIDSVLEDDKGNVYSFIGATWGASGAEIEYVSGKFINIQGLTLKIKGISLSKKERQFIILDLKNKKVLDDGGYGIVLKAIDNDSIELGVNEQERVRNMSIGDVYDSTGMFLTRSKEVFAIYETVSVYDYVGPGSIKLKGIDVKNKDIVKVEIFYTENENIDPITVDLPVSESK